MGSITQADETLGLPEVEADIPTLETLCLSAMKPNQSKLSLQDTVDFLKHSQKSQHPKLS